ncbi:hypothetical protein BFP97_06145 [Roseivirga sp. 4D4]|uniref:hypothetical protein n=1 Tax=Roseivirga sp. 4D4 TaxID=1889784 RepID=UPI0008538053|nr:hypothetical protein [Roseivirga sp. 4D4]OEK01113.1 hypothetical protein BFP97_06145 [Roseivirga sp. 4D4]
MTPFLITTIEVDEDFISVFSEASHPKHNRGGMLLTDRIDALNFRLRESAQGYSTNFHVAGDPTLIIVQQGTLRVSLQNGDSKDFGAGSMFIAKDYLPPEIQFDESIHGHKAEVIGEQPLKAVHIKLSSISG